MRFRCLKNCEELSEGVFVRVDRTEVSKLSWRNPRCLDSQRLRGYSIQDAESQLRLLLNQFPTHANAHLTLGILLEKAGHLNEALDHFAAAVENNPADQEARDRLNALNRSLNRP